MHDLILQFIGTPTPFARRHKLAGVVKVDGTPASRLVVVLDRRTCTFLAATTSNPSTGAWEIIGLPEYPERVLVVLAFDNTEAFNAEIADYITQVATV